MTKVWVNLVKTTNTVIKFHYKGATQHNFIANQGKFVSVAVANQRANF